MDLEINNLNALITGGSRGIGKAICMSLWQEGCNVSICARGREDLNKLERDLGSTARKYRLTEANVTSEQDVQKVINNTVNTLGGIDLLVLCAGGSVGQDIDKNSIEDWRRTFELNVFHSYSFIKGSLPYLSESEAPSIVIISSISGWKPTIHRAQYASAKAAQIHMVKSLVEELAPYGIRINSVSPGSTYIEGGSWNHFHSKNEEKFKEFSSEEFPFKRMAKPEEIADVCTFLLSKRSIWVNGANIQVDGGQRLPSNR